MDVRDQVGRFFVIAPPGVPYSFLRVDVHILIFGHEEGVLEGLGLRFKLDRLLMLLRVKNASSNPVNKILLTLDIVLFQFLVRLQSLFVNRITVEKRHPFRS